MGGRATERDGKNVILIVKSSVRSHHGVCTFPHALVRTIVLLTPLQKKRTFIGTVKQPSESKIYKAPDPAPNTIVYTKVLWIVLSQ